MPLPLNSLKDKLGFMSFRWAEKPVSFRHHLQDTSRNEPPSIPRITLLGMERAGMQTLFRQAPAVILNSDDRVKTFVESMFDWLGLADQRTGDKRLSFDSNLFDLARNHQEGNMRVGDMFRFVPKSFGHLARKFAVYRKADDRSLQAYPDAFYLGNRLTSVPRGIVESAWNLMSGVLASAMPSQAGAMDYAIEVDVLVYPTLSSDVRRVQTLLTDGALLGESRSSAGFWSQLGQRIDAGTGHAAGVFAKKGIRDLFAIASLIPGFRNLLASLNERMLVADEGSTPREFQVMAPPHVDRTRYMTALMGRRYNLDTQILWKDRWISLPVTGDAMAIFPSSRICSVSDITATCHRVLMHDSSGSKGTGSRNVTVSLAVVDRRRYGNV